MARLDIINLSVLVVVVATILGVSLQSFTVSAGCASICTKNSTEYIRHQLNVCTEDVRKPKDCPDSECCYAVGNLRHTNNVCICSAARHVFTAEERKEYNRIIYSCSNSERNVTCLL